MELNRRTLLRSIAATGVSATFLGYASASDGKAEYVATGKGTRTRDNLTDAGFEVFREVADSQVFGVRGPEDATEDVAAVRGVAEASRDVRIDFDRPVDTEEAGVEEDHPFYAENQWDNDVIEAEAAQDIATGEGTSVAVVDTGIDFDHSDLGNVNEDLGVTFVPEDAEAKEGGEDSAARGHGTNVAGVVGATGEVGVTGVAPDTELVPVRVFPDEGGARFIDIFAGIDYAADVGADAANFSLGVPGVLPPQVNRGGIRAAVQTVFQDAVRRGTVVTASAGNAGGNLQQGGGFTLPTSVPGTVSISATGPNDELVFYSNFGTNEIDVGGPGGGYEEFLKTLYGIREWVVAGRPDLRSDHPLEEGDEGELWLDEDGEVTFDREEIDEVIEFESPAWPYPFDLAFTTFVGDGYGWTAGTSFSAPQVAGLAALVRELEPDRNPEQVEQAIKQGAELAEGNSDPELGAGRVNALNTVERLDDGD